MQKLYIYIYIYIYITHLSVFPPLSVWLSDVLPHPRLGCRNVCLPACLFSCLPLCACLYVCLFSFFNQPLAGNNSHSSVITKIASSQSLIIYISIVNLNPDEQQNTDDLLDCVKYTLCKRREESRKGLFASCYMTNFQSITHLCRRSIQSNRQEFRQRTHSEDHKTRLLILLWHLSSSSIHPSIHPSMH